MSFEELAKRTAGTPEAAAHAQARAGELARKPFHDAWLADVYPHWQGPLNTVSRQAGVESVTHSPVAGFVAADNAADALKLLTRKDFVVSEILTASHVSGLRAVVAYAFAGDVNDGVLARMVGYSEKGGLTLLLDQTKQWQGPLGKLVEAAQEDVGAAASLFGSLFVAALDTREAREVHERELAARAERDRVAAEEEAAAAEEHRKKLAAEAAEQ